MLKFIKFFRGYLHVVIRGYSPERFLNLCSNLNIVLWDLRPTDDGYAFCISLQAFQRLKPILRKSGTRIRITERCGLPFLLFRYRKHRFFLCGICCAIAVLFLMTQFVWKVEITGNSFYSNQVLLDFLEDSGVGYGTLKKTMDCEEIETLLRGQFDDITWVSARLSGTRLYLTIQERVGGTTDQVVREEVPSDLVADCSGTIDSIVVRKGTPVVEKGDTVEKGDILVSGRVDIMDDAGEVAASNYCKAEADVEIHTSLPYENTFSAVYEMPEETGKKRYSCTVIFDKNLLQIGKRVTGEENWDSTTVLYPIKVGEDFYLPFQIAVTKQEQYEIHEYTYTDEEIKEKAERELALYCEKLRENAIQILANSVIIDKNEKNISVHGNLEALAKAREFQEISPADIQEGTNEDGIDTADDGHSD